MKITSNFKDQKYDLVLNKRGLQGGWNVSRKQNQ